MTDLTGYYATGLVCSGTFFCNFCDTVGEAHREDCLRRQALYDDTHAVLSPDSFGRLNVRQWGLPTGRWPGKCWRTEDEQGAWWLYSLESSEDPDMLCIRRREILLVDPLTPGERVAYQAYREQINYDKYPDIVYPDSEEFRRLRRRVEFSTK
jgi:hypothetical protein